MTTVPATGEVVADRSLVGLDLASAYTAVVDAWLGEVIDEVSGLPFEAHQVTRMVFNESGKVTAIASLTEDRFVLEQTGYNISR